MGEGGSLALSNGTKHTWIRTEQAQYQMKSWDFPEVIQPGTVESKYIEFDQGWFTTRSDTWGRVSYRLDGTDCKINFEIKDQPSNIGVRLENIETPTEGNGSWINLGWEHDGTKHFILSGSQGNFSSINPPSDWMHQNMKNIGSRTLSQICMPGTHDSGMGEITWSDNIPTSIIETFTKTQSRLILDQLRYGARYFDIRPQISHGEAWTGHYDGKLGARGQKISSIIDNINEFTENNKELIIVQLSHSRHADDNFREYNQDDWNSLMKELLRVKNRFCYTGPHADNILRLRLNEIIPDRAAVIFVCHPDINLGEYADQGFFLEKQLNVRDQYSDSDDCVRMVQDQITKMNNHYASGSRSLNLLSWTLTQQSPNFELKKVLFYGLGPSLVQIASLKSIKTMAYSANKALLTDLLNRCNDAAFPNVLYIDYIENTNYTALAVAINRLYCLDSKFL